MKKDIQIPDLDALLQDSKTSGLYEPTKSDSLKSSDRPVETTVSQSGSVLLIAMNKIQVDPNQVRRKFSPDELEKLAESIKRIGLLEPVGVRLLDNGMYQLCYGERRYRAANLAGMLEIPALLSEREEKEGRLAALHENLMREDLTPVEVALGIEQYARDYSLKKGEVARDLGMDNSKVSRYLSLLELSDGIQALITGGELKFRHGSELARFYKESGDLAKTEEVALSCAEKEWSVAELERHLKRLLKVKEVVTDNNGMNPERLNSFETSLSDKLKTSAQIKVARKGNGKIVINYANAKELETLMEQLLRK